MPRITRPGRGTLAPPLPPNLKPVTREIAYETQIMLPVVGSSGLSANPTLAGPLPRMPRIGPLAPTRLQDVLNFPSPRLLAPMDAVIAVRPYYARTAYTFSAPAAVPIAPSLVATPFNLGVGLGGLGGIGAFGATLYGNPALGTLAFTHLQTAGFGQVFGASFSDGYASISAGGFIAVGSAWVIPTIQVVAWDDSLGLYANGAYINPVTSVVAFGGINAAKAAKRRITNMGSFEGAERGRLALAHGLPADSPLYRVQIRRRAGWSAAVRAGGGLIWISGQLRIGESHTYDTLYRTFLDPQRARQLVFSDHGFFGHLRNFMHALNLRPEPIPIPKLKEPLKLPLGDQITELRSRSTIVSGMVGNLAGWGGAQFFIKGDISYSLRRLEDHVVELTVTPLAVRSVGIFGITTLGLEVTGERGNANSWRQTFIFDLSQPDARAAYDAALLGHLPGHNEVVRARRSALTPAGEPLWVDTLQPGVFLSFLQTLRARQLRYGGGFHAYIVPRSWLPKGWQPSFMRHYVRVTEDQESRNQDIHFSQVVRAGERRRAIGWKGLASHRLVASARFAEEEGKERTFECLSIGASWLETHASAHELTRRVSRQLQDKFGLAVSDVPAIKPRQERQLNLVRALREPELTALAQAADLPRLSLDVVAERFDMSARSLRHFMRHMQAATTVQERVLCTQRWLQRWGIRGFAVIAHLVPAPPEAYILQSVTTTYSEAELRANTLLLKYPETLPKVSGRNKRQLKRGIKKMEDAREILRADVFYPPAELKDIDAKLSVLHTTLKERAAFFHAT